MATSVVLEGIEATGKTTLTYLLYLLLEKYTDYPILKVSEPGGTKLGKEIRSLVLGKDEYKTMHPGTRSLLYTADRNELIFGQILPFMQENPEGIVVGDRTWPSTLALQGADGDHYEHMVRLNQPYIERYPTRLLFVDIPVEEAIVRLKAAEEDGREINWRDRQSTEKYILERHHYINVVKQFKSRFTLVDGLRDPWDTVVGIAYFILDNHGDSEKNNRLKSEIFNKRDEINEFLKGQMRLGIFDKQEEIRKSLGIPEKHELRRKMMNEWKSFGFLESTVTRMERI